jgi:hypothetical protein
MMTGLITGQQISRTNSNVTNKRCKVSGRNSSSNEQGRADPAAAKISLALKMSRKNAFY